ncbi:hypothetical protein [Sandarakinorhabdus oryzae]|uniref:hypothetical protein n=1 Tax=Sandarakinorhabdus oryzae TaxID=2675220 RepID=UPI0012E1CE3A|nr:hypothetical protein [Sandarakinorhabdus oryzae]
MDSRIKFDALIKAQLIPDFCTDEYALIVPDGFDEKSNRVAEADAEDFLRAWETGLASHLGRGRYLFASGRLKEQFFWEGSKEAAPRKFTLWLEPIITLGAIGRLHLDHGWPVSRLRSQSNDGAFDLLAIAANGVDISISGEVKKTEREADQLIELMIEFGQNHSALEPSKGKLQNAFRKVRSLRSNISPILWIIGPDRYERIFQVNYQKDGIIALSETDKKLLSCSIHQ